MTSESNIVDMLIVEDNQQDLDLTLRALRKANLANHIQAARDGQEALDILFCEGSHSGQTIGSKPKVIFLDVHLPKVDGLEVLRRIKEDPRTKPIPVVVRHLIEGDSFSVPQLNYSASSAHWRLRSQLNDLLSFVGPKSASSRPTMISLVYFFAKRDRPLSG
jgi:CheY-like chemotaxis protein